MLLNFKLKLLLSILIVTIIIIIILYTTLSNKFKSISFKHRLEDDLKIEYQKIRKNLQNSISFDDNYISKEKDSDVLKCFVRLGILELDNILKELDENENISRKIIDIHFLNYVKNIKGVYYYTLCILKKCPFIYNMGNIIKEKYKYVFDDIGIKRQEIKIHNKSFKEYIKYLGLFLANYKYVEKDNTFINKFKRKRILLHKQSDFKKGLIFTWRLGSYICNEINNNRKPFNEINLFDINVLTFINMCSKQKKGFPLGYDWFLFACHYPTILSYKLYIDYKTKKEISEKLISEILSYIPAINYSRNIQRYKSNVAILSINYIIANLFKYNDNIFKFNTFMYNILNSDIYHEEIVIQYKEPVNGVFLDGLYYDGGFIIHKNLVSYNYLMAYLYPSLFYKIMFEQDNDNIRKISKALRLLLIYNKRNTNPNIISRYGKFDETHKTWNGFLTVCKYTNTDFNLKTHKKEDLYNLLGIHVVESARVVIANFSTWSIQLKINSELAYGESDIFNRQILKQMTMSKIMFFDNKEEIETEFKSHSFYPGVLTYKQFSDISENFDLNYGTKTYVFQSVKYAFIQLDKKNIVIYSIITNKEFKISYEEFILITEYGIIVGYFNIHKMLNDDLYLTIETDILKGKVKSEILFSDNKDVIERIKENNNAVLKKVDKHVLYYNLVLHSPKIESKIHIKEQEIEITIQLEKVYHINLNKHNGLTSYMV